MSVSQEAGRLGIEFLEGEDMPRLEEGDTLKSLMFFIPLASIMITLAMGRSPSMADFWAAVTTVLAGLALNPALRKDPMRIVYALAEGGKSGAKIMMAVGTIGVMIAVFELTGVGLKFATQVALLGETSLFIALLLAAASCLFLGMGMPTLPAYMIIVLVLGTAMKRLGVETIAIHLFVFYFGVLSAITPPVALAAVAAAPIAGADPIRTGIRAMRLSLVGFIVPFVFVYEPSLLIVTENFTITAFVWVLLRLCLAILLLTSAMSGFEATRLNPASRLIRAVAGIIVITPFSPLQIVGLVVGVAIVLWDRGLVPGRGHQPG